MVYDTDAARLHEIVASDPSFRHVDGGALAAAAARLDATARQPLTAFALAAMRALALAGNGHTRVIPNGIAEALPMRLVWLRDGPCVVEAAGRFEDLIGSRLLRVGGRDIRSIHEALRPYLAGTGQRQKVIGALMLAWPQALRAIGLEADRLEFEAEDGATRAVEPAPGDSMTADALYPIHETGIASRLIHRNGLAESAVEARSGNYCRPLSGSQAWYVRLADLASEEASVLARSLDAIRMRISAAPQRSVLVDLRGNPGGDFLTTVDFVSRIDEMHAADGAFVVLVDKFTFSAAIVVAALLKHHARSCRIVGEEMGDAARFFAEGGTDVLAQSGLKVRHSTGYHDWQDGRADTQLTPPDIAAHMVAAGSLVPDIIAAPTSHDFRAGHDPALQAARRLIG